ncbi:MAG: hypothetical protein KKC25_02245, partial [Proteobacteria bacterium]|nr:hypothetical protein [Pseudomonadota bacterium]
PAALQPEAWEEHYAPRPRPSHTFFRYAALPETHERTFGLVKENRYRMEETNFYKGIDNVTIHAVEHDIVLTQDIIFDYLTTGKKSPVLKLNY